MGGRKAPTPAPISGAGHWRLAGWASCRCHIFAYALGSGDKGTNTHVHNAGSQLGTEDRQLEFQG